MIRRIAANAILVLLIGCSNGRHAGIERAVQHASTLVVEVDALEKLEHTETMQSLPESDWPAGIRKLDPEAVRIAHDGVFVQQRSRFVGEVGIFIAFAGKHVNTEPGQDPAFKLIADRLYSYKIKG
jgi:hypothetical protein